MLTTDVLPQYTSTSLGWRIQREMHTGDYVCGKENAPLASTHYFDSTGPPQPAYGPSVGPDAPPCPLSLKVSNTSDLDLCHLLLPPPEVGVPTLQALNPPCRSFNKFLLLEQNPPPIDATPSPVRHYVGFPPEASPTVGENCKRATDRAVPAPLSVAIFRESAVLENVVGVTFPRDAVLP